MSLGCELRDSMSSAEENLSNVHVTEYAAISYTWGPASVRATIVVDGLPLDVPKSSEEALRFALEAAELPVWIDAICINQLDDDERNHQVSQMKEVYSKAEEVLVWLGHDTAKTTLLARSSVETIVSQARQCTNNLEDLDTKLWAGTGSNRYYVYSDEPLPPSINWPALYGFFSVAWFTRLWPIQEVCLARGASCTRGSYTVPWSSIAVAAR